MQPTALCLDRSDWRVCLRHARNAVMSPRMNELRALLIGKERIADRLPRPVFSMQA